jgi:hypothetical protein
MADMHRDDVFPHPKDMPLANIPYRGNLYSSNTKVKAEAFYFHVPAWRSTAGTNWARKHEP